MRIAVIGGGLAGLTVAWRRATAGDDVVLFESTARLGGQLSTEADAGFVVEDGAEGFVASSAVLPVLAEDLGMGAALVGQQVTTSLVYDGTRLVDLAPGEAAALLGFQLPRDELGRGIRSFRSGMGQLTDGLAAAFESRAAILRSAHVAALAPHGGAWRIVVDRAAARVVDAIVVATPARVAAKLLEPLAGPAAKALEAARVASSVTVSLAYERGRVEHPLDATGCVVPEALQSHGLRACTFTTSKFADRAPQGQVLLRAFFRPSPDDLAGLDDTSWAQRAHEGLCPLLGIRGAPYRAWVSRWPDALPVFDDELRGHVQALETLLAPRGIRLAGSAFHGSGIDAAVRSAEACARTLG